MLRDLADDFVELQHGFSERVDDLDRYAFAEALEICELDEPRMVATGSGQGLLLQNKEFWNQKKIPPA